MVEISGPQWLVLFNRERDMLTVQFCTRCLQLTFPTHLWPRHARTLLSGSLCVGRQNATVISAQAALLRTARAPDSPGQLRKGHFLRCIQYLWPSMMRSVHA
jgi:hypothetical protein